MKTRVRLIVFGRVQGVFFRAYTCEEAQRLGITGYVTNRPDGTVEILAEGEPSAVDELVSWARTGSPMAHVERVALSYEDPAGDYATFRVT